MEYQSVNISKKSRKILLDFFDGYKLTEKSKISIKQLSDFQNNEFLKGDVYDESKKIERDRLHEESEKLNNQTYEFNKQLQTKYTREELSELISLHLIDTFNNVLRISDQGLYEVTHEPKK
jgi:hypothetical protein